MLHLSNRFGTAANRNHQADDPMTIAAALMLQHKCP